MGGRRDLIFDLSQTALDLNYDGLMIESHHTPDLAWSDAAQQITPEELHQIITALQVRKPQGEALEYQNQLKALRPQIEISDHQINRVLEVWGSPGSRTGCQAQCAALRAAISI